MPSVNKKTAYEVFLNEEELEVIKKSLWLKFIAGDRAAETALNKVDVILNLIFTKDPNLDMLRQIVEKMDTSEGKNGRKKRTRTKTSV